MTEIVACLISLEGKLFNILACVISVRLQCWLVILVVVVVLLLLLLLLLLLPDMCL